MTFESSSSLAAESIGIDIPTCRDHSQQRGVPGVMASKQLRIRPKYAPSDPVEVELSYQLVGAARAPVVLVQGGISAHRSVCARHADAVPGWWQPLVGIGKGIDLRHFQVLSIDWLDAEACGAQSISTEDQADALAGLLEALLIDKVHTFVGASYGAMVGLALASRHPQRLDRLVLIAGAHRPHPLASAQRAIQRDIVRLGLASGQVDQAMSLARQLAMTTYRGASEMAQRFQGEAEQVDGCWRRPVEAWLQRHGEHFAQIFSAQRFLALSESIDLHSIEPETIRIPTRLIGFSSDRLVPLADLFELQQRLGVTASIDVLDSPYGHDAFLKEYERLTPILRDALDHGAH